VAWGDFRNDSGSLGNDDIYAQRVNTSGVPQWASGGISLPAPAVLTVHQRYPQMISDLEGGALVTFQDKVGSWDITLVKLNPAGKEWLRGVIWDSRFDDPGMTKRFLQSSTMRAERRRKVAWSLTIGKRGTSQRKRCKLEPRRVAISRWKAQA